MLIFTFQYIRSDVYKRLLFIIAETRNMSKRHFDRKRRRVVVSAVNYALPNLYGVNCGILYSLFTITNHKLGVVY